MALTDWDHRDLWIAVFGLGSNLTSPRVDHILEGHDLPTVGEYEMLSLALNEHLTDLDGVPLVMSWNELVADSL